MRQMDLEDIWQEFKNIVKRTGWNKHKKQIEKNKEVGGITT